MKYFFIVLVTIGLLMSFSVSYAIDDFEIKVKPNSVIPIALVYSDDPSRIIYNRNKPHVLKYDVEVRGRCPRVGARLVHVEIRHGDRVSLTIPVSGNNASLTGNHGNQWEAHTVSIAPKKHNPKLVNACNAKAVQLLQEQSHDQVFNSNFTTGLFHSDEYMEIVPVCSSHDGYTELPDQVINLPARVLCEATGYESKLWVTESQLSLQAVTGQDGTCKLNISGEFRTSYELYALRSKNSTAQLRYRFKFIGKGPNPDVVHSDWWQKTVNPLNAGMVVFNYTDRIPSSINGGKVSLEVEIDGELYQGDAVPFSIDCADALPVQQTQTLDLTLSVDADKSETISVGGQLCPTHAILSGEVNAGYPINGNMVILGSTLTDLHVMPINLSASQSATLQKRIKLNWPSAANTLALNGGTPSTALKKQTLQYGLRVTNSNAEVVKSLSKKPFTLSCEYPSVNPLLPSNTTLGMIPDHTGGGGAPTSLQGKSPFTRQDGNRKPINAGLRSDGELVQARKPLNLLSHELSHTGQQGRMLMDADTNEMNSATQQRQNKNVPPSPTPIPYPTFGGKKSNKAETDNWPQRKTLKGLTGKSNSQGAKKDSLDRFANQQSSQQSTQQAHTIPLHDATISAVRSEQLNRGRHKKTTLFKGKIGSQCKKNRFPKNAVINQSGRQRAVECINGRVVINRTKKVQQPWQTGDPVL